eukprot:4386373-Prymnesium_polylepis.1
MDMNTSMDMNMNTSTRLTSSTSCSILPRSKACFASTLAYSLSTAATPQQAGMRSTPQSVHGMAVCEGQAGSSPRCGRRLQPPDVARGPQVLAPRCGAVTGGGPAA